MKLSLCARFVCDEASLHVDDCSVVFHLGFHSSRFFTSSDKSKYLMKFLFWEQNLSRIQVTTLFGTGQIGSGCFNATMPPQILCLPHSLF